MTDLTYVIPAAGEGKRLQRAFPGTPKALVPLAGRPMIEHVLSAVHESGVAGQVAVVVSPRIELQMRKALQGWDLKFAMQPVPRGTGDAVIAAQSVIGNSSTTIVVLFADQPIVSPCTIRAVITEHKRAGAAVTMATLWLQHFSGSYNVFHDFGRVLRGADGCVRGIVEARDATESQLRITEVNPSLYCFSAPWLWTALSEISTDNAQGEYLLTDIVRIAVGAGLQVQTVPLTNPLEMIGANTPEQLRTLEQIYQQLRVGRRIPTHGS